MENMKSSEIMSLSFLACPYCKNGLVPISTGLRCKGCNSEYLLKNGQLDLRLNKVKKNQLDICIGKQPDIYDPDVFSPLQENPEPDVDFSNMKAPHHLTKEMMTYFPKAMNNDSYVLDIGCGSTLHKGVCEHAGFKYIGLDYDSAEAGLLADGHALPFYDESFDFMISIAALEHMQYPLVMLSEAYRVLKKGGMFIGTVAFLEAFHSNSYYHHTHLGVYNSLKHAGFEVENVSPSTDWTVLFAQSQMSLFPRLPKIISKSVVLPLYLMHRIWWKLGYMFNPSPTTGEKMRLLKTTGSFIFIAKK